MTSEKRTKVKLSVISVAEPVKVGQNNIPKLSFKANANGQTAEYMTFTQHLFPLIVAGTDIEVDVETTQKESPVGSGRFYTDNKITRIYQEKPTAPPAATPGIPQGKLDKDASIESQVAAKIAGELVVADRVKITDPLGKQLMKWLEARLPKA